MECFFNSETDTDCYVFTSKIYYPNVSLHTHNNVDGRGDSHCKNQTPNYPFLLICVALALLELEEEDLNQTIKPTFVVIFWTLLQLAGLVVSSTEYPSNLLIVTLESTKLNHETCL